VWQNADE